MIQTEKSGTLCPNNDQTLFTMQGFGDYIEAGVASALKSRDYKDATDLVAAIDCRNGTENPDVTHTLQAKPDGGISLNCIPCVREQQHQDPPAVCGTLCGNGYPDKLTNQDVVSGLYPVTNGAVRRLTPLECERLQGYPDGWTDIGEWEKTDSKGKTRTMSSADSLRYKALGNSIALPPWAYVLTRLSLCIPDSKPTMASLFDGIGGFPLIWEWLNGKGSCLWASEIEDFPIAVTTEHFTKEEQENENHLP